MSPRKITWEELCGALVREIDSERLRILAVALERELDRRKAEEGAAIPSQRRDCR